MKTILIFDDPEEARRYPQEVNRADLVVCAGAVVLKSRDGFYEPIEAFLNVIGWLERKGTAT